jgi:hypothetical protein
MGAGVTTFASPARILLVLLLAAWKRHRCDHTGWTPLDAWCCPACGKERP